MDVLGGNGGSGGDVAKIFLDCGNEGVVPPPVRDVVRQQLLQRDTLGNGSNKRSNPKNIVAYPSATPPSAILAVGPERGWTQAEADWFCNELGYESATLGQSVLRVDTAVVAGLAVVSAALEELMVVDKT